MKVIAMCNQKGGVGKTTLTRELGCYLAYSGRKVLLIDADGQANLTKSFFENEPQCGLYEALTGAGVTSGDVTLTPVRENLVLLSGSIRLSLLEKQLVGEIDGYLRLKELLSTQVFDDFELCIIDTPPSLGILTGNALAAADLLLIPISPAQYALQGTSDLLETMEKMRRSLNPNLAPLGVIVNAYSTVTIISRELVGELRSVFGTLCFQEELGRSIRFEEAIAEKKGLVDLNGSHWEKSRDEVMALGEAVLNRLAVTHGTVTHGTVTHGSQV